MKEKNEYFLRLKWAYFSSVKKSHEGLRGSCGGQRGFFILQESVTLPRLSNTPLQITKTPVASTNEGFLFSQSP